MDKANALYIPCISMLCTLCIVYRHCLHCKLYTVHCTECMRRICTSSTYLFLSCATYICILILIMYNLSPDSAKCVNKRKVCLSVASLKLCAVSACIHNNFCFVDKTNCTRKQCFCAACSQKCGHRTEVDSAGLL